MWGIWSSQVLKRCYCENSQKVVCERGVGTGSSPMGKVHFTFVLRTRSCTVPIKTCHCFRLFAPFGLRNSPSLSKVVIDQWHEFFKFTLMLETYLEKFQVSSKKISQCLCFPGNRRLCQHVSSQCSFSIYIVWKLLKTSGFHIDLDKENIGLKWVSRR